MSQHVYDAAIVGAGPIGIELAVAMHKAGIDYVHFDAKQIGYTVSWYAPQTRFFSSNERIAIAGVPLITPEQGKATREQYLAYLRSVVEQFDLTINTYEPVTDLVRRDGYFDLATHTSAGSRQWRARNVALCTGGTDRPRMLGVPGEDLPHVSHYFRDPHEYFRKRVLIVGGRNSAVEAALRCHHAGARVTLSYRRPQLVEQGIKYWLMPELRSLMNTGRIQSYFGSCVTHISPAGARLRLTDGTEFEVAADFLLLLTGYEQDMTLLRNAGVELSGPCLAPRYDPTTMQTNIPGLYVAGTAIGGTQERYTIFIENCHEHVEKIMRSMFHVESERHVVVADTAEMPES
ncbi:MAG: NAD(P)-binding domain-containing protein [Burkholderiales bacterium]|nr:NAD(P)-binding domain-containing protein [Phycisphaerae bacterium]